MVDFVKIISNDGSKLRQNPLLNFKTLCDSETSEKVVKFDVAEYKNLKFKLWENDLLILQGSLHKYFNNGQHNHNDFSHSLLVSTLKDIEKTFGLDLKKCTLQNIEFGVNIEPIIDTHKILRNLIHHKTVPFEGRFFGNFYQVQHEQYFVKIYDKANQYHLNEQKMRYELKFIKMEILNKKEIFCLNDLIQENWKDVVIDLLLKQWNEVFLFDTTIQKDAINLKNKEIKLLEWGNDKYWIELDKHKRHREKKAYTEIVRTNSSQIHANIGLQINSKWLDLCNS